MGELARYTKVDKFSALDRDDGFRWVDQRRNHHRVEDMGTRHLFNTLKMLWNHSAPPDLQFRPFRQYQFVGIHARLDYQRAAVVRIGQELAARDLTRAQQAVLQQMEDRLAEYMKRRSGHALELSRG